MWLNGKTLDLRTLDFSYTNLEPVKDGSSGSIIFQSMPSGVPMIVRWTIHSPIIATDESEMSTGIRRSLPPRPERHRYRVLGYQVLGAEARQVTWPDGSSWQPRLASVAGLVVDLRARRAARARLDERHGRHRRDRYRGGVSRARPIGGLFSIVAADSTLAADGINQTPPHTIVVSDVRPDATSTSTCSDVPRADALRGVSDNSYVVGQGVAVLRVIDTAGVPARRARIDMEPCGPSSSATRSCASSPG